MSAFFETVINLPIAAAGDIITAPVRVWLDGRDSLMREVIERIEKDLRPF